MQNYQCRGKNYQPISQKPNPIIVLLYISSRENHKLNLIIVLSWISSRK